MNLSAENSSTSPLQSLYEYRGEKVPYQRIKFVIVLCPVAGGSILPFAS